MVENSFFEHSAWSAVFFLVAWLDLRERGAFDRRRACRTPSRRLTARCRWSYRLTAVTGLVTR